MVGETTEEWLWCIAQHTHPFGASKIHFSTQYSPAIRQQFLRGTS